MNTNYPTLHSASSTASHNRTAFKATAITDMSSILFIRFEF